MTILDCCISLRIIKKKLVVLGVVDMRQLLLRPLQTIEKELGNIYKTIDQVDVFFSDLLQAIPKMT